MIKFKLIRLGDEGDEILRQKVVDNKVEPKSKKDWVKPLKEWCKKNKAIGISANQLGFAENFLFIGGQARFSNQPLLACNTRILEKIGKPYTTKEGCRSLNGEFTVTRYPTIKVEYEDVYGKTKTRTLTDYEAQVFQHEYDHLEGVLLCDHKTQTTLYTN